MADLICDLREIARNNSGRIGKIAEEAAIELTRARRAAAFFRSAATSGEPVGRDHCDKCREYFDAMADESEERGDD